MPGDFDRLAARKPSRVTMTKPGRIVATPMPPEAPDTAAAGVYGCMRGTVIAPPDFDLTEPVLDEAIRADEGML